MYKMKGKTINRGTVLNLEISLNGIRLSDEAMRAFCIGLKRTEDAQVRIRPLSLLGLFSWRGAT